MTPSPTWPVPSSVALGVFNDGVFEPKNVFSIEWTERDDNYFADVYLPSNTVYTAMAVSMTDEIVGIDVVGSDDNFDEAYIGSNFAVWQSNTAMSDISGSLYISPVEGKVFNFDYAFE